MMSSSTQSPSELRTATETTGSFPWIDAHSHLADPRWLNSDVTLERVLDEAASAGIRFFLQGGVDPNDWDRQLALSRRFPAIWPVFGLHPYFVAAHSDDECEGALDRLAKKLPHAHGLGETGLDFRPRYVEGESEQRQIAMFEAQLEIAGAMKIPVVLHVVRAFEKATQVVDLFFQQRPDCGMVHAFNGTLKEALAWVDRGFLISVGGPVCRPDNQKLHQAVRGLPLESLVLETDSPDQAPPEWSPGLNHPSSLLMVAKKVAEIRGMTSEDLRVKTGQNLARVFPVAARNL